MIRNPEFLVRERAGRMVAGAIACIAVTFLAGCAERKVHAFPWKTAAAIRPNLPPTRTNGLAEAADIAPDFRVEPPANNARVFGTRPTPARPRVASSVQPENGNGAKTQLLVPELSPQEAAAAKQQFTDSAATIERNLVSARGRKLTPVQTDMVSKVNGFMAEAREASQEGDWARARNLARKAQILSEELIASF